MDHQRALLSSLGEASDKGELAIILHVFSGKKEIGKMILSDTYEVVSNNFSSELSERVRHQVADRQPGRRVGRVFQFSFNYDDQPILVIGEHLETAPQLCVFGAGHVGQAVAVIGALVGYNVTVIDDRAEFLAPDRFPNKNIKLLQEKYESIKPYIDIPSNSAVVIVTRGHQYDEICLQQILTTGAKYIGMIGSRRRVLSIFSRMTAAGINRDVLDKVHAPIGLSIGAVSPQEIAVAIMAEIISVMNNSTTD